MKDHLTYNLSVGHKIFDVKYFLMVIFGRVSQTHVMI